MTYVESRAPGSPQSVMELARENLYESLLPYFKGKNKEERLDRAVNDALNSISHMLSLESARKNPLGATVMTEGASATKKAGSQPRNL